MSVSKATALCELVKQLRKRAGMTQRDLAALNYSDALISNLEHAQRLPDVDAVVTRLIAACCRIAELPAGWKPLCDTKAI